MKNKANKYSPEEVWNVLDVSGMNAYDVECHIAKSLAPLPEEIVDFVAENVVILSESISAGGTYWNFNDFYLKGKKGFILLNADLWKKSKAQIAFTVAHEVAHAYVGHSTDFCIKGEEEVALKKERDADKLAMKWLSDEFDSKKLLKLANYLGKC